MTDIGIILTIAYPPIGLIVIWVINLEAKNSRDLVDVFLCFLFWPVSVVVFCAVWSYFWIKHRA